MKNNNYKNSNNNRQNQVNKITAPYNFVPLNKEIFYPKWSNIFTKDDKGNEVHNFPVHDIPLQDGQSGEIDIEIISHSPIFIRNHYQNGDDYYTMTKEGKKVKISKEFCHFKNNGGKQFYIPASSIKGMIRNTLEIMSFSKIRIDEKTHKKTMSVRDMTSRNRLVGTAKGCGFLVKENNGYFIKKCHEILTISHDELKNNGINTKRFATAKEKYKQYNYKSISYSTYKKTMDIMGKKIPKIMAKLDDKSQQKGMLVFTGDIDNKKHEFVFSLITQKVEIDKTLFDAFRKVYFEDENSIDGQYWKGEWEKNKEIPIFFSATQDNKINAIGLTQLFKLAYEKTILQAIKQNTQEQKLDLAETIFGIEEEGLALKGRVYFSHLKSNIVRYEIDKEIEQVLGGPNPSYYPNYIEQTDISGQKVNKYTTLMDKNATIRGFKRYPLQNGIQHNILPTKEDGSVNHDVATKFKPLQKGTSFKGKLRFHNLKKEEIGAVLSALTFHGQNNKYFHNIGMAKPLGYGKIEIKLELNNAQKECLTAFEDMMNAWDKKEFESWKDSKQLKELFAMSDSTKSKNLKYQQMEKPTGKKNRNGKDITENEFVNAKKAKEFLVPYSGIVRTDSVKPSKKPQKSYSNFNSSIADAFGDMNTKEKRGLKIVKKAKD